MRNLTKVLATTAFLLAFNGAFISPIYAQGPSGDSHLVFDVDPIIINSWRREGQKYLSRQTILQKFLERYQSPLETQAKYFLSTADRYNLDWRLLPAIAGMESTFGKFMIEGTYNPFGWGGGVIPFDSWEEAIETVGRQLFLRFSEHTSPEEIGPTYTPPNYVNWIYGVKYFMREMGEMELAWRELPTPIF